MRDNQAITLGHQHTLRFMRWAPDRALNPQYDHLPDVQQYGALVEHQTTDGRPCTCVITFDGPVQRELAPNEARWQVQTWEPLTLTPSLVCPLCGDHGFIRDSTWIPA